MVSVYQAVGEKTGKVLQGQLSELNKKISEVNLQVMLAPGALGRYQEVNLKLLPSPGV